jgi:hypothetical protein
MVQRKKPALNQTPEGICYFGIRTRIEQ